MSASDVEILIPAAAKDYATLPYTIAAVRKFWPEYAVHILTPTPIVSTDSAVTYHLDADALGFVFDKTRFTWRPGWCMQQFLKLFNTFTTAPYLFVVCGDVTPLRRFALFDGLQRSYLFTGLSQYCPEYFIFNQVMFGIGKVCPSSFITECTLYRRDWLAEMISAAGCATAQGFIEKASVMIHGGCFPAEQELYGSFALARHPQDCVVKPLKIHLGGHYCGDGLWTPQAIEAYLQRLRGRDFDYAALHSWWDEETR